MSAEQPPSASVTEVAARPAGVLIDVREDDEWAEAHVPDAIHIPMAQLTLDALPEARPLSCMCRSGNRSGFVVAALVEAGIDARNVTGGMQAWTAAGLPVAT